MRTPEERKQVSGVKALMDPFEVIESLRFHDFLHEHAATLLRIWGSEVLPIDFDSCRRDQLTCFNKMTDFLGVPRSDHGLKVHITKTVTNRSPLEMVENAAEMRSALLFHGYHDLIHEAPPNARRALDCKHGVGLLGNTTFTPAVNGHDISPRPQGYLACCAASCGACNPPPDSTCGNRPGGKAKCCVYDMLGFASNKMAQPHFIGAFNTRKVRFCADEQDTGCIVKHYSEE